MVVQGEELRKDVRDAWLHKLLPVFSESLVAGRGSSSKAKQVLEVLAGRLEQILADFPVLGRVQITGHKKGWAGFS